MKKFIFKVLNFTIIYGIFLLSTILIIKYFSKFKIEENANMMIVGHSHSACAFDEALIDGLCNYSSEGESYFYSFYKVKKMIDQNPQIQTLFIEFSNNQISKEMDDWIWGDNYMSHRFPKYAFFMEKDAVSFLLKKNPKCLLKSIVPAFNNNMKIVVNNLNYTKENGLGGYIPLERERVDSIIKHKKDKEHAHKDFNELSNKNLEYLSRIIKYSQEHNVKVFLVRSPLHKSYDGLKNEPLFQKILQTNFSDIEFLDFSKYPLKNSEFGDLSHLNYKGAQKFSKWFNTLIHKDSILHKTSKQNFIDRKILTN